MTSAFGGQHSIQLSYGCGGADHSPAGAAGQASRPADARRSDAAFGTVATARIRAIIRAGS